MLVTRDQLKFPASTVVMADGTIYQFPDDGSAIEMSDADAAAMCADPTDVQDAPVRASFLSLVQTAWTAFLGALGLGGPVDPAA